MTAISDCFTEELALRTKEAEEIIYKYLPAEEGFQKTLISAMNYSVAAGGKRLRPILMREMFLTFGGEGNAVEAFMAAMEYIHTYSLVHDDLPAMDNDELRRGKPTTWKTYGDGMGTLAGDALLNYAYETMLQSSNIAPATQLKAMRIVGGKAGTFGMVGGQSLDVEKEGQKISAEEMNFIHKNKTCALLEASLMAGAVLSEKVSDKELEIVEKIGYALGMAFQIQDDILDVTSTTEELGKPVGSDEKNEKNTYVSIYGLEASKKMVEEFSEEAVQLFDSLQKPNAFLHELMLYLMNRKN